MLVPLVPTDDECDLMTFLPEADDMPNDWDVTCNETCLEEEEEEEEARRRRSFRYAARLGVGRKRDAVRVNTGCPVREREGVSGCNGSSVYVCNGLVELREI